MSGAKKSGAELTSFCPSVSGTNKNETSFGLEMSQTGFSSHIVEVRTGLELPSCPLTLPSSLGHHLAILGLSLIPLSLFLGVSLPLIFCGWKKDVKVINL